MLSVHGSSLDQETFNSKIKVSALNEPGNTKEFLLIKDNSSKITGFFLGLRIKFCINPIGGDIYYIKVPALNEIGNTMEFLR